MDSVSLTNEFMALQALTATCKAGLVAYIQDLEIPLNDRWDMFKFAPSCLKNREGYIWYSGISLLDDMLDGESYSKFETVYLDEAVGRIEQAIEYDRSIGEDVFDKLPEVIRLKEKILSANLGSFVFDW